MDEIQVPRSDFYELDREERKTIYELMVRLPKDDLVAWLVWCCRQVSEDKDNGVMVSHTSGHVREVWEDWFTLCHQFNLDWRKSRAELELRVRRAGKPLLIGVN